VSAWLSASRLPRTRARIGALNTIRKEASMARTYHAIDADGHILEPVTLWD
jgi:hypothetical protein